MIESIKTETLDFAFREAMKKEAIAFAEWIYKNGYAYKGYEEQLEQLYKLFCSEK